MEYVWFKEVGCVDYWLIIDFEVMDVFGLLCCMEGIILVIEFVYVVVGVFKLGVELGRGVVIVVNLLGCGDKDVEMVVKWFGLLGND